MAEEPDDNVTFPIDPLKDIVYSDNDRRRAIAGILESYNSTYDTLIEAIQNSVDALEDAFLAELGGGLLLHVTIDLTDNWLSVFDTGMGMSPFISYRCSGSSRGSKSSQQAKFKRMTA